jgi:hypothetical protein
MQAQVREDADDDSRIFDGGDDLRARATVSRRVTPEGLTRPTQLEPLVGYSRAGDIAALRVRVLCADGRHSVAPRAG